MYYYFTPLLLPLLVSASVLVVIASYARSYAEGPAASALFWAIISIALWSLGYAFEIAATEVETKLLWANVQFFGIGAAPILWLTTIMRLLRTETRGERALNLLWLIPVVTLFLAFTDRYHGLFRHHYALASVSNLLLLDTEYGWWHDLIFVPYQYTLYFTALVLLVRSSLEARPYYRRRYLYMLLVALLPLVGSLFYVFGMEPFSLVNPSPIFLTVAVVIFAVLVFRNRLFDVRPVARASIVENLAEGVLVLDGRLRIVDFNPAAQEIFPLLAESSIGMPGATIFGNGGDLGRLLQSSPGECTHYGIGTGEAQRQYRCSRAVVRANRKRELATILIFNDETEERRLLKKLEDLASIDALTGLANRRTIFLRFEQELERARRHGHPISFIIMDLDHFKRVNDSYGHAVGDEVLRVTGATLRESVRFGDVIGRYGGEEFALCLPETTPEAAMQFAERLRRKIGEIRVPAGDREASLTASFGVCGRQRLYGEGLQELLRHADAALYRAKHLGRNRTVYCDLPGSAATAPK
ncbi:MAG: histidine kinase N-terminal 7TM domain-containing protein [Alkalispirochaetaceae bacterium]